MGGGRSGRVLRPSADRTGPARADRLGPVRAAPGTSSIPNRCTPRGRPAAARSGPMRAWGRQARELGYVAGGHDPVALRLAQPVRGRKAGGRRAGVFPHRPVRPGPPLPYPPLDAAHAQPQFGTDCGQPRPGGPRLVDQQQGCAAIRGADHASSPPRSPPLFFAASAAHLCQGRRLRQRLLLAGEFPFQLAHPLAILARPPSVRQGAPGLPPPPAPGRWPARRPPAMP